jgi:hypothetical protein
MSKVFSAHAGSVDGYISGRHAADIVTTPAARDLERVR